MKKIQQLKKIDLIVQVAAIILPWLFFALIPAFGRVFQLEHILASYFIVGTCQVTSWLINRFRFPSVYKARSRGWYEKALMVLIVLVPASIMLKVLLFVFVLLLYVSPVMAFWYLGITIAENRKLSHPIPNIDTGITETHLQ